MSIVTRNTWGGVINKFNKDRTDGITDNCYINQSGVVASDSQYYLSYPIPVIVGKTYTWRFNADEHSYHNAPTVGFYDSSDNLLSVATHSGAVRYFSFTIPNNCSYIKASVFKPYKDEAMLNEGSTALPYHPYYEWVEQ